MILWTIQTIEGYEKLVKDGVLTGDPQNICDPSFKTAYEFMMRSMIERGIKKPERAVYPIWAWYQWQGQRKKRDLRCGGMLKSGKRGVQLTIDVADNEVLLSDFELWHYPLNGWYLTLSEEQAERENLIVHTDEQYQKSWQKMFDVFEEVGEDCYYTLPLNKRSIQASLWQVKIEQVKSVQHFISR